MSNVAVTRRQSREQRSDVFFACYLALGSARSIRKVRDFAVSTGMRAPTLSTLSSYSADYGWVARAHEFDAAREEREGTPVSEVFTKALAMDERHMKLGKTLQEVGEARMGETKTDITPSVAVRMMDVGVKMERLAGGLATERIDFTLTTINQIIMLSITEVQAALALFVGEVPDDLIAKARAQFAVNLDDGAARLLAAHGVDTDPA